MGSSRKFTPGPFCGTYRHCLRTCKRFASKPLGCPGDHLGPGFLISDFHYTPPLVGALYITAQSSALLRPIKAGEGIKLEGVEISPMLDSSFNTTHGFQKGINRCGWQVELLGTRIGNYELIWI